MSRPLSNQGVSTTPEGAWPAPSVRLLGTRCLILTVERTTQALKAAGYDGLDTGELVEAVHASGVKRWEDARIAKSSVASSCTHDPAFVRLQKGRFALRALRPDLEVMPCAPIREIILHLLFWVSLPNDSCLMLCLRPDLKVMLSPALSSSVLPVHLRSGGSTDDGCCLMLLPCISGHAV